MKSTIERTDIKEWLDILGKTLLVGVYILQDGKFCYINPNFPLITGYSTDELIGKDSLELVVPEDREMVREKAIKMLKGELLSPYYFRVISKDSSIKWLMETVSSIQYRGRRATLGNYMEITEHKQAEEVLKESEEKYKELANSISDVFFAMNDQLKYIYWNKASEILTGIRAEDVLGKSLLEIFPDTPAVRKAEKIYRMVLRTQQPQTFVNDFDIEDKHYIFDISAYPSQGGISVFVRDITEHKRAEEALRESEEKYRLLSENASDIIWTTDMNLKYTYANPSVEKLLGYTPKEFTTLTVDKILTPASLELAMRVLQEELAVEQLKQKNMERTRTIESECICKNGTTLCVEVKMTFLRDKAGHPISILGIARDITHRKRESDQLIMADRLASIGELAAGAAHELNNPLTSVIGFAQLLMEKNLPDYIRRDLAIIQSEAQRAANVTSNLLTFARKHIPIKQLNKINNIVEDVLKLRAYGLKVNNIEVVKHLDPNLPEIMVDYFQMQQVFLNIIINAEYFMTEAHKKGTMIITTKKHNSVLVISFADDGPGIPPENLSRIFDPFFTTKGVGKGTGLGLSICHGVVAEHHGQIYAKSQLGKGATIFIELPINSSKHIESIQ